jgi:hypothetical protein
MYFIEYDGKFWTGDGWCSRADREKLGHRFRSLEDGWRAADGLKRIVLEDVTLWFSK